MPGGIQKMVCDCKSRWGTGRLTQDMDLVMFLEEDMVIDLMAVQGEEAQKGTDVSLSTDSISTIQTPVTKRLATVGVKAPPKTSNRTANAKTQDQTSISTGILMSILNSPLFWKDYSGPTSQYKSLPTRPVNMKPHGARVGSQSHRMPQERKMGREGIMMGMKQQRNRGYWNRYERQTMQILKQTQT